MVSPHHRVTAVVLSMRKSLRRFFSATSVQWVNGWYGRGQHRRGGRNAVRSHPALGRSRCLRAPTDGETCTLASAQCFKW
jgi:hypothetical protein